MAENNLALHVGTSGYSYKEWLGCFYPEKLPATEMLRCEAGDHDWERPKRPGTKPRSCPEHRRTRARVIALAPRPGAIGASEPCLEAV